MAEIYGILQINESKIPHYFPPFLIIQFNLHAYYATSWSFSPNDNSQLHSTMHTFFIFLVLSVASATESIFADWLPEVNSLGEYNLDESINTQSDLYEDPLLFTPENPSPDLFESQSALDAPFNLFADTSSFDDECAEQIFFKKRPRRQRREAGAVCSKRKKKQQQQQQLPNLGIPTLSEIEAQIAGTAATAEGLSQARCPLPDHPDATEAVCSSGDPNDERTSAVFPNAMILLNCERREYFSCSSSSSTCLRLRSQVIFISFSQNRTINA